MTYVNQTTNQIYVEGRPFTYRVSESELFSGYPTAEQLTEWGFVPFVPPVVEEEGPSSAETRMNEILEELQSMDYLTSKYIDGEDMTEYGDWQGRRRALREEYNQLEEIVRESQAEEGEGGEE